MCVQVSGLLQLWQEGPWQQHRLQSSGEQIILESLQKSPGPAGALPSFGDAASALDGIFQVKKSSPPKLQCR